MIIDIITIIDSIIIISMITIIISSSDGQRYR